MEQLNTYILLLQLMDLSYLHFIQFKLMQDPIGVSIIR